jgi:hypothetical protein
VCELLKDIANWIMKLVLETLLGEKKQEQKGNSLTEQI